MERVSDFQISLQLDLKIVQGKKNNDFSCVCMRDLISYLNLPVINNIDELSYFLTFTKDQLNSFMFAKKAHYVTFKIPKKNSSEKRIINAPKKRLKMAQKVILVEILEKIPCSNAATAFIKNENGILKNALVHTKNIFLLKMDFKDFFQNISTECIKNIFLQLGYNEKVSHNLASLCTFANMLPQGGVCSPYLSNLACYQLDQDLEKYCNSHNIKYTRYADDLLFSSNDIRLLESLKKEIVNIVKKNRNIDFNICINHNKTRLIRKNAHKKVTGITINNNLVKASKQIKNMIRQELYYILKKDLPLDNKLIGKISYVISIESKEYASYLKKYIGAMAKKTNKSDTQTVKRIIRMADKVLKRK